MEILRAVFAAGNDAYGVRIASEIEQDTGRRIALPPVYKALMAMEAQGYVTCGWGEPSPQRGGRRKKLYRLTGKGQFARNMRAPGESIRPPMWAPWPVEA